MQLLLESRKPKKASLHWWQAALENFRLAAPGFDGLQRPRRVQRPPGQPEAPNPKQFSRGLTRRGTGGASLFSGQ